MPGGASERKPTLSTNRYPDGRGLVDPLTDGIEQNARDMFSQMFANAAEDLAIRFSAVSIFSFLSSCLMSAAIIKNRLDFIADPV